MKNRSVTGACMPCTSPGPSTFHLKQTPGADFDHPASFRTGEHIGAFDGDFQSIVSVTSPKKAIETLAGSLQQTGATRFTFGGVSHLLGQVGLHLRVTATGDGTLLDPATPKALLLLAGNMVVTLLPP